jgi:hypothetical protein
LRPLLEMTMGRPAGRHEPAGKAHPETADAHATA